MEEYGFFESILMSFYSSDFYQDVSRRWGILYTLGYLFLILMILNLMVVMHWQTEFIRFFNLINPTFISITERTPEIVINHGEVSTPENKPYYIPFATPYGNSSIIIDTSGKYTSLDENNSSEFFTLLLTKTRIFVHAPFDQNDYPLSDKYYDIKPNEIKNTVERYYRWIWIPVLLFEIVSNFFISIIHAIIGSIIGIFLFSSMRLSFIEMMTLFIVSMTPSLFVANGISLYLGSVSFHHWVLFIMEFCYFYFAVISSQKGRF